MDENKKYEKRFDRREIKIRKEIEISKNKKEIIFYGSHHF